MASNHQSPGAQTKLIQKVNIPMIKIKFPTVFPVFNHGKFQKSWVKLIASLLMNLKLTLTTKFKLKQFTKQVKLSQAF